MTGTARQTRGHNAACRPIVSCSTFPSNWPGSPPGCWPRTAARLGTRRGTRALTCWKQAVFVLGWFRDRPDIVRLGHGFGISQATAYRYLDEAIEVLAAQAPGLREALEKAKEQGLPYLILDGKDVAADRCKEKATSRKGREIDRWYSGKAHAFGGNIQALFTPSGIRCGSLRSCPAEPMTSPPPASSSSRSCGPT